MRAQVEINTPPDEIRTDLPVDAESWRDIRTWDFVNCTCVRV
jgi:hypothetical protein